MSLVLEIRIRYPGEFKKIAAGCGIVSHGAGIHTWAICLCWAHSESGFLNLNIIDVWGWTRLCCANVHCRMFAAPLASAF